MGAVRHLTFEQALAALRRGKPVEQLLESPPHEGRPTVRWLTVNPGRDEVSVWAHHVYDEGDLGTVDVTAFSPVDVEEYADRRAADWCSLTSRRFHLPEAGKTRV